MAKILVEGFMCERCHYHWAPRPLITPDDGPLPEPKPCPNCKSRYWNKPRQLARAARHRAKIWQVGGVPDLVED